MLLLWQQRHGLSPGDAGFNLIGRAKGACYSELRKLNDGSSPRAKWVADYEALHGTFEPRSSNAPRPPPNNKAEVLNALQAKALQQVKDGDNIFLTGGAGTGKSHALREIIKYLKDTHGPDGVGVTASTGCAAIIVGGTTVHSFLGWWKNPKVFLGLDTRQRLKIIKCLVIDEISMIDEHIMDTLIECFYELHKGNREAFPQLVFCGDFAQLGPVSNRYAFQSKAWGTASVATIELVEPMRQLTDKPFFKVLTRMRKGIFEPVDKALLDPYLVSQHHPLPTLGEDTTILPTHLYCTNKLTDIENEKELGKLTGASYTFELKNKKFSHLPDGQEGHDRKEALEAELAGTVSESLEYKVGAQVFLTRNWKEHHKVNGSRGVIVGFEPSDSPFTTIDKGVEAVMATESDWNELPIVKFMDGEILTIPRVKFAVGNAELGGLEAEQIPLRLAWALMIHRAQGASLDAAVIDLTGSFAAGQVYTALSRMRDRKGLWLVVPVAGAQCDQRVREFYGW